MWARDEGKKKRKPLSLFGAELEEEEEEERLYYYK